MLGLLFEDGEVLGSDSVSVREKGPEPPPRVRAPCGLSGINNQGATCYLNSLIQTLVYTPEFRESLFCLGEDELGRLEDTDKPGAKVRVIPIQLQRLFVRLLLLNIQAVSTEDLTRSFGWTNNEQFQQHDVQELNRILFSAIESSLVGTSGKDIISKLYHGRLANKITCTECGYISERQEEFLDIPLSVAGSTGVEDSLQATYLEYEMMEGKNQYRCSKCNKLVDAKKGAKIRCLPSILTISLLRFSFNFQRMERYKETGKFTFPYVIDMKPYCDDQSEGESWEYELFSVVIHSGGAHGGHYHAYIRDIDQLGTWVAPEEEEIVISKDLSKDSFDVIQCDSPVQLVEYILSKEKDQGMSLDKISQEIQKQTGTSWKKRFKNRYGSMTKFLASNSDKFIYHPAHNFVFLKLPSQTENSNSSNDAFEIEGTNVDSSGVGNTYSSGRHFKNPAKSSGDSKNTNKSKLVPPDCKDHWFDFNDSRVHPIHISDLEKQFSGRESAYMLFYRKKSMTRPSRAQGDPYFNLPEALVNLVLNENIELDKQRQKYEDEVNSIKVQIHFGDSYIHREGALKPLSSTGQAHYQELTIDRRKSTEDLFNIIREIGSKNVSQQPFQVNILKELPAGGHLYQQVPESSHLPIMQVDVTPGSKLFVWDGEKVQGQFIETGAECEPVLLTVNHGEGLQSSCNHGFQKSLTLEEVKIIISDLTHIPLKQLQLQRYLQEGDTKAVEFSQADMKLSVLELKLQDGDQLVAIDRQQKTSLNKESVSQNNGNTISVVIENRCVDTAPDVMDCPAQKLTVEKDITIADLKAMAISMFGLESISEGGRLRIDDQTLGLRHPLHGEATLSEARVNQGMLLVLEPGPAPTSDQITLWFSRTDTKEDGDCMEIMVKRSITAAQCLQCMLEKAQIQDCDWHLRKTNWCGEADKLLDDPDLTLDASLVNDGDHILLEPGRLPPKGFMRLTVMLHLGVQAQIGESTSQENHLDCKNYITKIKELYAWHFPELGILVKDELTFVRVVKLMGCRSNAVETDFSEILAANVEQQVKENAEVSMGVDVGDEDIRRIQQLCDKVLQLKESKEQTENLHPVTSSKDVIFKPVCPLCLGVVEISKEATLTDLKQQIMTLNSANDLPIPSPDFMRLRVMEHGRLCNVLKNKDQSLKRYKLQPNGYLALQILAEEENLSDNQVVLDIWEREPGIRQYKPPIELIWDTGLGTSVHHLKQAISRKLHIPTDNIAMAKHMFQRFEWSIIEEKQKPCNVKGKKKGGSNLRQAPYYIKDGDTIGVKNVLYDPDNLDNFGTMEDDIGKKYLEGEAERKRKDREERKKLAGDFGEWRRPRKPEVGITIQVGDFS